MSLLCLTKHVCFSVRTLYILSLNKDNVPDQYMCVSHAASVWKCLKIIGNQGWICHLQILDVCVFLRNVTFTSAVSSSSSAVFTSACSSMAIYWALHACCQSERRGKQPLFSLQRNKSIVFCNGTMGTTVCCEDDMTLQTATRSCMIIRQMSCWARRKLCICHLIVEYLYEYFKEGTKNRPSEPIMHTDDAVNLITMSLGKCS